MFLFSVNHHVFVYLFSCCFSVWPSVIGRSFTGSRKQQTGVISNWSTEDKDPLTGTLFGVALIRKQQVLRRALKRRLRPPRGPEGSPEERCRTMLFNVVTFSLIVVSAGRFGKVSKLNLSCSNFTSLQTHFCTKEINLTVWTFSLF